MNARLSSPMKTAAAVSRLRLALSGTVQGVGFRPFVYRLATDEDLGGSVRNTGQGVVLEIEGTDKALARFLTRLKDETLPPADIRSCRTEHIAPRGDRHFAIVESTDSGRRESVIPPDLATCGQCLAETLDPSDRRYRYPFTTCVSCGPRYSIIELAPYDRDRTTMGRFAMCSACQAEYDDPESRRFHAQTNACPECGPRLALWDANGAPQAADETALTAAADALREGRIVALKGIGGFQLLADARNESAIRRLRERKRRPAKPFALMAPLLADVAAICDISAEEQRLLESPAAPIVLLRAHAAAARLAPGIAPANPRLGVMLPSTPLHHLLLRAVGFPVVATSGNRSGEPIVTAEDEALVRLAGVADLYLVHDRPIAHRVDDSVVQMVAGEGMVLRCARGYAPVALDRPAGEHPVLALGGHQKNSLALMTSRYLVLGPHVGDLEGDIARAAFGRMMTAMTRLYDTKPEAVACDRHPDYHTTSVADALGPAVQRVLHHHAHVLAGMADNGLDGPVLGVAWDGAGHGGDGTLWGGEFLIVDGRDCRRVAHWRTFRLPGGEAAVREPRRCAIGALYEIFGAAALDMTDLSPVAAFEPAQRRLLGQVLDRGINAPCTSSVGRLFDVAAAVLGLCQTTSFEGEAAMAVEHAAARATPGVRLAAADCIGDADCWILDWRPVLRSMVVARREGVQAEALAAAFHEVLVAAMVAVAGRVGLAQVVLTGGCFQNVRLAEEALLRLRQAGFQAFQHRRVPPNDGGLAVGQAVYAGLCSG